MNAELAIEILENIQMCMFDRDKNAALNIGDIIDWIKDEYGENK